MMMKKIASAVMAVLTAKVRYTLLTPVVGLSVCIVSVVLLAAPGCHQLVCRDTPNNREYLVRSLATALQSVTKIETTYMVYNENIKGLDPELQDTYGRLVVEEFDSTDVATAMIDTTKVNRLVVVAWKGVNLISILYTNRDAQPNSAAGDSLSPFSLVRMFGWPGIVSDLCWDCDQSRIKQELGTIAYMFSAANPNLLRGHDWYEIERVAWAIASAHVTSPLMRRSHGVLLFLVMVAFLWVLFWHYTETEEVYRRARNVQALYLRRRVAARPPSWFGSVVSWDRETYVRQYERQIRADQRQASQAVNRAQQERRRLEKQHRSRELERITLAEFGQRVQAVVVPDDHPDQLHIRELLRQANDSAMDYPTRRSLLLEAEAMIRQPQAAEETDIGPNDDDLHLSYEDRLRARLALAKTRGLSVVQAKKLAELDSAVAGRNQGARVRALEHSLRILEGNGDGPKTVLTQAIPVVPEKTTRSSGPRINSLEDVVKLLDLSRFLPAQVDQTHASMIIMMLLAVGQRGQSAFNAKYREEEWVRKRVRGKLQTAYDGSAYNVAMEFFFSHGVIVVTKYKNGTRLIALNSHFGRGAGRNKRPIEPSETGSQIVKEVIRLTHTLRQATES